MPKQECGEYGKPGKQNRPLSVCCSKFGFCGSTSEFCDAGCQQRFGECGDVERPSCSKDGGSISQQSIGYYESWANTRACSNVAPEDLNLDGLTHVNFAFVFFNPGTFSRQPEDFMTTYGFEGMDLDWEYTNAGMYPSSRSLYMCQVRSWRSTGRYCQLCPAIQRDPGGIRLQVRILAHLPYILLVPPAHRRCEAPAIRRLAQPHVPRPPRRVGCGVEIHRPQARHPYQHVGNGPGIDLLWRAGQKNPHCNKPNGVCEFSDGGKKGRCSKASGILTLQEIKETIKEKSLTQRLVTSVGIHWANDQWVSYDDADTFQKKKEFANSRCLGGTMVWALDQVDQSSKSLLYAKEWTEKEIAAAEDTVRDESVKGVCYTTTKCGGKCRKGDHEAAQMSGQPGLSTMDRCPRGEFRQLCCAKGTTMGKCRWRCADFKTELTQNTNHDSDKSDQTCTGVTQSYCCAGFQPPITKEQIKEKVKDKAADAIEAAETLALEVAARAFCRIDITAAMKPLTFIPAVGECLT
ncbi:glycoside hydrolase family 18 protein [Ophiocordyceps sinensis CO18]|uniref:chitinase n=1 Tax=Ophiocordyceps sinensis (strain Co18 / CGMCC 3.14243) TaxID=911162 RepID=T5AL85_OPHSC|nr:glycoside hydrolase family 18 protein [Ophiocordyceps sinensis CO18]